MNVSWFHVEPCGHSIPVTEGQPGLVMIPLTCTLCGQGIEHFDEELDRAF